MEVSSPEARALISNPYVVGRPLTGASASLYMGRQDVFDWFDENLSGAGQPNALLLYGQRRIGKTSTLYQLVEGERGQYLRANRSRPLYPVYIDLQRYAGRPTDEWLRRLARDICRGVDTSSRDRSVPDAAVPGETAYAAFDRCLDRLESTLPDGSLIMLAIDEFEQIRDGIESGMLELDVIPFLRSQIQHRIHIVFLVCGSPSLLEPFWSPIVDLTARLELGPLSFEEASSLIRQPIDGILGYEDEAVEAIWQFSSGHPFLIQTACHRLVSLANRRHSRDCVQPDDVRRVVEQMNSEGYGNGSGLGYLVAADARQEEVGS